MWTDRKRREYYARAGLVEPIPSVQQQRLWCWIDNRVPPAEEADGEFETFTRWLNHAASWIGWSGSSCFDALDRPCYGGRDFMRARDEGAFPVRWYWPPHFPDPEPVSPRYMRIRRAIAAAGERGVTIAEIRAVERLGNVGPAEVERATTGRVSGVEGRYVMDEAGIAQTAFETACEKRASYVRG